MDASKPYRVTFALLGGYAMLSFAAAAEPLRAANHLAGETLYDLRFRHLFGDDGESSNGFTPREQVPLTYGDRPDMLVVVAGGDPFVWRDDRGFALLRSMARRGVILCGVSGGPVVLANAGLLTGRRITVHWEHAEALAELHPDLVLERSLYVIDRDRITCAGGTAPLDLMHALIAGQHGAAFAQRVSDWFMHTEIRPSGGPQRASAGGYQEVRDARVIAALQLMEDRIGDPLSLAQLARLTGVSGRQLHRLFDRRMGEGPMTVYRDIRLEKARQLLAQTGMPVTEVALAAGFSNPAHFAAVFKARFGVQPSTLRK